MAKANPALTNTAKHKMSMPVHLTLILPCRSRPGQAPKHLRRANRLASGACGRRRCPIPTCRRRVRSSCSKRWEIARSTTLVSISTRQSSSKRERPCQWLVPLRYGFSDRRAATLQLIVEPRAQRVNAGPRLRLPCRPTLVGGAATDAGLDRLQFAEVCGHRWRSARCQPWRCRRTATEASERRPNCARCKTGTI
jgi:hypothetical protein